MKKEKCLVLSWENVCQHNNPFTTSVSERDLTRRKALNNHPSEMLKSKKGKIITTLINEKDLRKRENHTFFWLVEGGGMKSNRRPRGMGFKSWTS